MNIVVGFLLLVWRFRLTWAYLSLDIYNRVDRIVQLDLHGEV